MTATAAANTVDRLEAGDLVRRQGGPWRVVVAVNRASVRVALPNGATTTIRKTAVAQVQPSTPNVRAVIRHRYLGGADR